MANLSLENVICEEQCILLGGEKVLFPASSVEFNLPERSYYVIESKYCDSEAHKHTHTLIYIQRDDWFYLHGCADLLNDER